MKKMTCILLVTAMLLSLFCACGASTGTHSSESATKPSSVASSAIPPEESVESTIESSSATETDLNRPSVTYPLVDETETLSYWVAWPPFLSAISEPQDAAIFEELEKVTGVHLDITTVSTETATDDFMLRCASNDLTDMIQGAVNCYTGGGTKAIEDEILMDLLPLLKEHSQYYYEQITQDPEVFKRVLNDEGQIPAWAGMYTDYYYTDQGWWIRQDILDAVDMSAPTTVAELDDVLAAFQGYGMTDGLVVLFEGLCDLLECAYDAKDKIIDGKVTYQSTSDHYRAFLEKMHEYYEKGYINSDFVSYTESDTKPPQDVILSDNGGIFNEDVASISGYYLNTTNASFALEPLAQIRINPDDVLDTGYTGVKVADKYTISISAQCKNPKLAVQYMDYLYTDDGFILSNYGIEGETYTVENGECKFTDLILNNPSGFDWQLCQSLYINPGFPCLTDLHIQEMTYNDAQKRAVDVWTSAFDSDAGTLPNEKWLTYTTEESEIRANIQSDIDTFIKEWRLKFITGQQSIADNWDTYCTTLESMGYYELEAIDQASYDRYISK